MKSIKLSKPKRLFLLNIASIKSTFKLMSLSEITVGFCGSILQCVWY